MDMTTEPLAFETAADWRTWLGEHHATEDGAWLFIAKKRSTTPLVTLAHATEEALCFGWIDSAMRPIDEERYALRYTPRRKGSNWSERNKASAARLIEAGRMTEAGFAKIQEAKRSGRWTDAPGGS
jgi:uncharacterized protein YdeI (YjbR/CyaY-like superfamily)